MPRPYLCGLRNMSYDATALLFAQEFYRSLALGYPVDTAMAEARRGIFLDIGSGRRDWATPVLFLRVADGQLFDLTHG